MFMLKQKYQPKEEEKEVQFFFRLEEKQLINMQSFILSGHMIHIKLEPNLILLFMGKFIMKLK